MKTYPIEFEIAGPMAMFARPDTGASPVSSPVPPWSVCKAWCESVAALFGTHRPSAFFSPTAVELWQPIRYERYKVNYRGPLRKPEAVQQGTSYQLAATVLVDVCYRVRAECIPLSTDQSNVNAAHALQEIFNRRLSRGQSKYTPSLGWQEFVPSYFGKLREVGNEPSSPKLQTNVDLLLPALLLSVWDAPVRGKYQPTFRELAIRGGVLNFPKARVVDNILRFAEPEPTHAG